MRTLVLLLGLALVAPCARASDLQVLVKGPKGQPIRDAVVTYYPQGAAASSQIRFDWPYREAQENLQFDHFVLVVPEGATVVFPNRDTVRHQVYSFSPAKSFELKLYGREETRTVKFDRVGVIALGCNIHDSMVAFIKVVDTPFAAKTGASGEVVLHGLPAGQATVRVWHPYLRGPANEVSRQLTLRDGAPAAAFAVELRKPPVRRGSY